MTNLVRPLATVCLFALALVSWTASASPVIYGLKSAVGSLGGSGAPTVLFSLPASSPGTLVQIDDVERDGNLGNYDALAMSGSGGLFAFELTAAGSQLVSIDKTSAAATAVGSNLAGRELRGATFNTSGNILAFDRTNTELIEISTSGAVIGPGISLTGLGAGGGLDADIAFAGDGTLYLGFALSLYTVDLGTGAATQAVTNSANQSFAGLAFQGPDGDADTLFVYDQRFTDEIYTYDVSSLAPDGTFYASANTSPLLGFNSGGGDLAGPAPVPAPLPVLLLGIGLFALGIRRRRVS